MKVKLGDIIKLTILAAIIVWIICFIIDYARVRQIKKPLFCLSSHVTEYEDGTTYSCTGFGYKAYLYNRVSVPVQVQFGPFFIKERT